MAEERPRRIQPGIESDPQDDVLGKIDQLLNRHRSAPSAAVPSSSMAPLPANNPGGDGIPVLTDMVAGPGLPAARVGTIDSALILRRMAAALEAEQSRLLAQIGNDATQAGMLERLVAELKRSLPAAVRAAITHKATDPQ